MSPHFLSFRFSDRLVRQTRAAFFSALTLACLLVPVCLPDQARAYETRIVTDDGGTPLFELRFFDKGEWYFKGFDEEDPSLSSWTLDREQKNAVTSAAQFLADVIGPGALNTAPLSINVGTYDIPNAECACQLYDATGSVSLPGLQTGLLGGTASNVAALVLVGTLDSAVADHLSPLPALEKIDLASVISHELIHGLGMYSYAVSGKNDVLSVWDTHLVDAFGTALTPGMTVTVCGTDGTPGKDFIVGYQEDSGVTFHGEHVHEVMGTDTGLPVEGYEWSGTENGVDVYVPDLSHIELEHGFMSHQSYRNHIFLMEAEIAALQDIGYSIDRKKYFGYSVYGNGETIVNRNGYFARNEEGTAFLSGQAGTTTLGTGLHIYGKANHVTQAADLLACGTAGTGIRVDGSGNTLILSPDVLVAADGAWGTGILVSYGKDQTIISRGSVEALGTDGIAARFDFGNNSIGNDAEYRGSWIWNCEGEPADIQTSGNRDENGFELNLDGPLASTFDVSGLLAGQKASIFISRNAFVRNINILSGASVYGDIISEWDPELEDIQYAPDARDDLHTSLSFGLAPDAEGRAGEKDDAFDMTLYGGIDGEKSLDMRLESGHLTVTGTVNAYSLRNAGHLDLYGMNADGDTAAITASFINDEHAVLETGFSASGEVLGITAGQAELAGTWALRPLPDFYASNAIVTPEDPVTADTVSGKFSSVTMADNVSPTLQFSLTDESSRPSVLVSRAYDAYSRHAGNEGAESLGHALYDIADHADGDMRNLIAALDWSGQDGSGVTRGLNILGPGAYDISARTTLSQMSEFTALLYRQMTASQSMRRTEDVSDTGAWNIWLSPYGSGTWQGTRKGNNGWHSTGAGFLLGADRFLGEGLTLGGHLATGARRTSLQDDTATAETRFLFLGSHALLAPERWNGLSLTAQLRLGMENGDMDRNVFMNDYFRNHKSDWTGLAGSAMIGAGRDWTWTFDNGVLAAGPAARMEYHFLQRPGISEHGDGASRLRLEATRHHSAPLTLGAHIRRTAALENGIMLDANAMAAWSHEWADVTFRTDAHFKDCRHAAFSSATDTEGRDALLIEGSLRLTGQNDMFLQADLGGELFRDESSAVHAGLTFGWKF